MVQQIEQLVSTNEAARILGLKPNTLAKWRVSGGGPIFVSMGRAVRYRVADLAIFVERNARQSTSRSKLNAGTRV